jgi:small subunit ribosomal protein S1
VTRALEEQDWRDAIDLMESQDVFESAIVGFNKGGVIVRLGQLRGFVPLSQLNLARGLGRDADAVNQALRPLVGKPVFVKVIEVSRERNRLILSERAAAREARASRRANMLDKLDVGETRTGRVVNLADFGAFVDIGGVEGLVHLSELSWRRVGKPGDVVQVGDEVEVYVLNVDEDKQRVALSMKRLMPDPWDNIDELYQEGQLVEASVTKLVKFGAFASLNDDYGLEGLIHISELSDEHVKFPADVVKKGQTVTARIIRIDADQRQIGLSLKQVTSDAFMEFDMAQVQQDE